MGGRKEADRSEDDMWMSTDQQTALASRLREMSQGPEGAMAAHQWETEDEEDTTPVRRRGQTASLEIQQLFSCALQLPEDEGLHESGNELAIAGSHHLQQ